MLRKATLLACMALIGQTQAQDADIVRGEYWIDQDQGFGQNFAFEISDAPNVPGIQLPISLAGYGPGIHSIGIRTLDDAGHWSLTNFSTAVVIEEPPTPPSNLVEIEYFLNLDPGFGNGLTAWTGSSLDTIALAFEPDLSNGVTGINTLFTRSRTSDGLWSLTNHSAIVVIDPPEELPVIERVEAFTLSNGSDPGFGAATPFTIADPMVDFTGELESDVPFSILNFDTLAIRSRDSNGRWSLTNFLDSVDVIHVGITGDLVDDTNISVYPNPFTEGFNVKPEDGGPLRVILYDPQGKLLYDRVITGNTKIDLSKEAAGSYTAFFWKDLKVIHRVQLVKQ